MDLPQSFPLKIGQDAESKSHTDGYRGAWFRCKVKNITIRGGDLWCALEYFDYPGEKVRWTKVYQKDPVNRKKMQLMVRPCFPDFCCECDITERQNDSKMEVIINKEWQVGNLVDLWYDCCFWSGKIAAILDNNKVQVDLTKPPIGEGGSYEADCKDLRPTLLWSVKSGWSVPLRKNRINFKPCVRLISPLNGDPGPALHMNTPAQDKKYQSKSLVMRDPSSVAELKTDQENDLKRFHSLLYEKQVMDIVATKEISHGVDHPPVTAKSEGFPSNALCQSWQARKDELQEGGTSYVYHGPGVSRQDWCMTGSMFDREAFGQQRQVISVENSVPGMGRTDCNQFMINNSVSEKRRKAFSLSTYKKDQARVIVKRAKSFCHERGRLKCKSSAGGKNCLFSVDSLFDMPSSSNEASFSMLSKRVGRNKNAESSSCMHVDEIESSVMALEEFANKVKWLRRVMQFGFTQGSVMTGMAWQFSGNQAPDKQGGGKWVLEVQIESMTQSMFAMQLTITTRDQSIDRQTAIVGYMWFTVTLNKGPSLYL